MKKYSLRYLYLKIIRQEGTPESVGKVISCVDYLEGAF